MVKNYWLILINVLKMNFKILIAYPRVFVPLALRALVSSGLLCLICLMPYHPFRRVLGAPVAEFLGAEYLRYPHNFTAMPLIFTSVRNFVINPLFSSLMIAVCCGMVYDYHLRREPGFWRNFNKAVRRFWPLFLCMLFLVLLGYGFHKAVPFILRRVFHLGGAADFLFYFLPFVGLVLAESLFVFCFVAIMTKRQKAFRALKESAAFSLKMYPVVFLLVFLPRLLDFLANYAISFQARLADIFLPDIIILVLILTIIIAVISDTLVFSLTANLYALNTDEN